MWAVKLVQSLCPSIQYMQQSDSVTVLGNMPYLASC